LKDSPVQLLETPKIDKDYLLLLKEDEIVHLFEEFNLKILLVGKEISLIHCIYFIKLE
jgi:hypothetical protein